MSCKKSDERIKILDMIAADMKNDARDFDGRPFNGKTVAQYFGNHGAAIAALARIMKAMQQEIDENASTPAQASAGEKQAVEDKCCFSTDIAENITCCTDGKFDQYGFPVNICKRYPCEKYKELVNELIHRSAGKAD